VGNCSATPWRRRLGRGLHEGGKRFGEVKEVGAQAQCDANAGVPDMLGGERDDAAEWLRVKDYQGTRDPVSRIEGVVSHQTPGNPPAFLGVRSTLGLSPVGRWEREIAG
jgi:hypothetical protein